MNGTNELSVEQYHEQLDVVELRDKIENAVKESSEIVVVTPSDLNAAAHYIKNFKDISKKVETLRKDAKAPLIRKGKEIDAFFKSFPILYQEEQRRLEGEVREYSRKIEAEARKKAEAERREAEERALAEAIEKENRLKAEAKERGDNPDEVKVEVAIVPETAVEEKKISSMNTSGLHMRRERKWRYTEDFDIVSFVNNLSDQQIREFVKINESALRAERMKHDIAFQGEAPGLKGIYFYYEENPV